MLRIISLVQKNELWFYAFLIIVALWYIRAIWNAQYMFRISAYGLERETARIARARALSMLVLVFASVSLVYLTARHFSAYIISSIPDEATPTVILLTSEPTATPDVVIVLPGQPTPTLSVSATPLFASTLLPPGGVGCTNSLAKITSPLPGAVLSGFVEVQGVANIPNLAFYVLEISTLGSNWLNIYTANQPVDGGVLGNWDSGLYSPGDYSFRLVVHETSGAFVDPCTIPITIGAGP